MQFGFKLNTENTSIVKLSHRIFIEGIREKQERERERNPEKK